MLTKNRRPRSGFAEYAKYRERMRPLEKKEWQQEYLLDIKELERIEAEMGSIE